MNESAVRPVTSWARTKEELAFAIPLLERGHAAWHWQERTKVLKAGHRRHRSDTVTKYRIVRTDLIKEGGNVKKFLPSTSRA